MQHVFDGDAVGSGVELEVGFSFGVGLVGGEDRMAGVVVVVVVVGHEVAGDVFDGCCVFGALVAFLELERTHCSRDVAMPKKLCCFSLCISVVLGRIAEGRPLCKEVLPLLFVVGDDGVERVFGLFVDVGEDSLSSREPWEHEKQALCSGAGWCAGVVVVQADVL